MDDETILLHACEPETKEPSRHSPSTTARFDASPAATVAPTRPWTTCSDAWLGVVHGRNRFEAVRPCSCAASSSSYFEGTLPGSERVRMEAHLAECDGCAGYLEDMRRLVGSLHMTPEEPPDPAAREPFYAAFRDLRGG